MSEARSSATRSWPPRSSTASPTTARSPRSTAPATASRTDSPPSNGTETTQPEQTSGPATGKKRAADRTQDIPNALTPVAARKTTPSTPATTLMTSGENLGSTPPPGDFCTIRSYARIPMFRQSSAKTIAPAPTTPPQIKLSQSLMAHSLPPADCPERSIPDACLIPPGATTHGSTLAHLSPYCVEH